MRNQIADDHVYFAHMYAMFLLSQFRESRAYPCLLRLRSLPSDLLDSLCGDFITVTMAVELLKRGVSDENVAAILGNSPLIVQKPYAPFVQARQLILEKQVMATW